MYSSDTSITAHTPSDHAPGYADWIHGFSQETIDHTLKHSHAGIRDCLDRIDELDYAIQNKVRKRTKYREIQAELNTHRKINALLQPQIHKG